MKVTNLVPTNGRKSFYGKAKLVTVDDTTRLMSYDSFVAEYNHTTKNLTINGWFSATTAVHINSFLELYDFPKMSKTQMLESAK